MFWGAPDFVSAYEERNKNFFRKIQFSHFLPTFFAEKCANIEGRNNELADKGSQMTTAFFFAAD